MKDQAPFKGRAQPVAYDLLAAPKNSSGKSRSSSPSLESERHEPKTVSLEAKLQRRVQRYGWDIAASPYEGYWRTQLEARP